MRLPMRWALPLAAVLLAVPGIAAVAIPASAQTAPIPDRSVVPPPDPRAPVTGEERTTSATLRYSSQSRETTTQIHYANATYVKVHFTSFSVAPGDFVTVADPTGREVYTYHGDP